MSGSRTARVAKWVGAIVCTLMLGMWLWTGWNSVGFWPTNPSERVVLAGGNIYVLGIDLGERRRFIQENRDEWRKQEKMPLAWVFNTREQPVFYWEFPKMERAGTAQYYLTVPLWLPFVLVAVSTAILWYRGRRYVPAGHCRGCGYNLTGNTSGVCPECGTIVEGAPA